MLACAAAAGTSVLAAPAAAEGSYSPYDETPTAALARYVRALAENPKDFTALVGAGRSALQLGDTQAAAGFFARADEANPQSPQPQAGMGAVSVANGDARAALPYFERARQLGASVVSIACDRGLAYDLLGRQAEAQADYRVALNGRDRDEARRRLALSLAISGKRTEAIALLGPLMAKGDAAAARTRAFVLALTGDSAGARVAIDAAMPGNWARVSPFLARLPALQAGQKAAAVNLGIFPDSSGGTAYAYALPPSTSGAIATVMTTDRLAGIDALLKGPQATAPRQVVIQEAAPPPAAPRQVSYNAPRAKAPLVHAVQQTGSTPAGKVWLQLASGHNAADLPGRYRHFAARGRDLFDGIKGYVAKSPDRVRLVIGPFRGSADAAIFAEDLRTAGINAFRWTNSATDRIVPIAAE
jgi:Flp pilus assembly protein TadD